MGQMVNLVSVYGVLLYERVKRGFLLAMNDHIPSLVKYVTRGRCLFFCQYGREQQKKMQNPNTVVFSYRTTSVLR